MEIADRLIRAIKRRREEVNEMSHGEVLLIIEGERVRRVLTTKKTLEPQDEWEVE